MPILKKGAWTSDEWISVDDDTELPAKGDLLVSLTRYQENTEALTARAGKLGVRLEASEAPEAIADAVGSFDLITIDFPAFKDGRGYSYARLLRERFGYTGELRAVGNVLRDQLSLMWRCGFDAFHVNQSITPEVFAESIGELTLVYQPTGVTKDTIMNARLK